MWDDKPASWPRTEGIPGEPVTLPAKLIYLFTYLFSDIDIPHGHDYQSTDMRTIVNVTTVVQDTDRSQSFNSPPVTPVCGCFLTKQVGTTEFSPNSP